MTVIVGHDACGGAGGRVVPAPEVFDHRDEEGTVLPRQLPSAKRGEAARRWPGPTIQLDES
ncbi:MAG: ferredoxin [Pseudonocardiaceae bacterium]